MSTSTLATATSLLTEAVAGVRGNNTTLSGDELLDMLTATRELSRLVSQLQVETIAALDAVESWQPADTRTPSPRSRTR